MTADLELPICICICCKAIIAYKELLLSDEETLNYTNAFQCMANKPNSLAISLAIHTGPETRWLRQQTTLYTSALLQLIDIAVMLQSVKAYPSPMNELVRMVCASDSILDTGT